MKVTVAALLLLSGADAFVQFATRPAPSLVAVRGYLDDLQSDLYAEVDNPDLERTRENTNAKAEDKENYGVKNWDDYVEFDEFDGGDGQMGVAGDGNKGLEKLGGGPSVAKSKTMSAKNAWGTDSGYGDELRSSGMETQRAQQLENWQNQQELRRTRLAHQQNVEEFDQVTSEEDWRTLSKFGVERTQDFDLAETFGPVTPGDQVETIELHANINAVDTYEFSLKNDFMGFADFRAAFTDETPNAWSVQPEEGTLSKEPVTFVVRFRAEAPGIAEGYLVIDTEDMKKTYKVIGNTA